MKKLLFALLISSTAYGQDTVKGQENIRMFSIENGYRSIEKEWSIGDSSGRVLTLYTDSLGNYTVEMPDPLRAAKLVFELLEEKGEQLRAARDVLNMLNLPNIANIVNNEKWKADYHKALDKWCEVKEY